MTAKTVATPVVTDEMVSRLLRIVDDSKGKVSFAEAIDQVLTGTVKAVAVVPEAPKPVPITEEHRAALTQIAEVYGRVAPSTPRLLNASELKAIVEERAVIDTVVSLLATRKDTSIREALANHADKVAERDALADDKTEKDAKGHYALKQDIPVPETALKVSRSVSEPKPVVSSKMLRDLWVEGVLTREEYLSLTTVPEVDRVFDEAKSRKAIKKNPALLAKIAAATTRAPKTTTIKVAKNSG